MSSDWPASPLPPDEDDPPSRWDEEEGADRAEDAYLRWLLGDPE